MSISKLSDELKRYISGQCFQREINDCGMNIQRASELTQIPVKDLENIFNGVRDITFSEKQRWVEIFGVQALSYNDFSADDEYFEALNDNEFFNANGRLPTEQERQQLNS